MQTIQCVSCDLDDQAHARYTVTLKNWTAGGGKLRLLIAVRDYFTDFTLQEARNFVSNFPFHFDDEGVGANTLRTVSRANKNKIVEAFRASAELIVMGVDDVNHDDELRRSDEYKRAQAWFDTLTPEQKAHVDILTHTVAVA